jgi:hypothetical protein
VCLFVGSPPAAAARRGEEVEQLISTVKIGSLRERLETLEKLAQLRDVRQIREWDIVDLLMELAKEDNPRIARRAVAALGDLVMGADKALKALVRTPLVKVLRDSKAHSLVRVEAARQLGRILVSGEFSDAEGINALARAATHGPQDKPEVAAAAILALGDIGDKAGKNIIRNGLGSKDPIIREAALEAIESYLTGENAGSIVDGALGEVLLRLLRDDSLHHNAKERILQAVARTTKHGGPKRKAEQAFLKVIKEESRASTVVAALRALGFAGSPDSASAMVATYERFSKPLEGKEREAETVRAQVCATVGEFFDAWGRQHGLGKAQRAAGLLSELLTKAMMEDQSQMVKKEAIVSLGNLYDRKYDRRKPAAALIALLGVEDTADDLKSMAAESLEVLSGRSFGSDADRWEAWFLKNQHKLAPLR